MKTQSVAIVGASGYSGEELVRLLARHPHARLAALTSRHFAGRSLGSVYPRFAGTNCAGLEFIESDAQQIAATGAQVAFLALPHGVAKEFAGPLLEAGLRVIDLSADFRIKSADAYRDYYGEEHGAPELLRFRDAIAIFDFLECGRLRHLNPKRISL
jgi:N-acetyl-gamma-glutamyl-phosphate reductase